MKAKLFTVTVLALLTSVSLSVLPVTLDAELAQVELLEAQVVESVVEVSQTSVLLSLGLEKSLGVQLESLVVELDLVH